ncbi:MAG: hypothetical protein ABL986_07940 [Vicinamibacterales bacterium]
MMLSAQGQGAIVKDNSDAMPPPQRTFREAVDIADAVVVIRVLTPGHSEVIDGSAGFRRRNPGVTVESSPDVVTSYQARIVSVLKADSSIGVVNATTKVVQGGGEGEWQGRRVIDKRPFPPLVVGRDYLVLLSRDEDLDGLVFDPYQAFEIRNGRIQAGRFTKDTQYISELLDKTVEDVAVQIREMPAN